jgi:hypothetical protein
VVVQTSEGSFDCGFASLREAKPSLRMTGFGEFGMTRSRDFAAACALLVAISAAAVGQAGAGQKNPPGTVVEKSDKAAPAAESKPDLLVIEPVELPGTYPHGTYLVRFHVRGDYVPSLHWRLTGGTLPPGITLDENGVLRGEAERAGVFQFSVEVRDGSKPQRGVVTGFVIKVVEGLVVAWKVPAHVTGNRIDGSVEVTNSTADDVDLTFDVKAVAENGRATEIGYQHFPLKRGTVAMALPFGETLPHGAYVVYVNVNGEVAKRNAIYKQQMQTPTALQVVVGP